MEGRAHSVAGIQSTAASEGVPLAPCGRRLWDLTRALGSRFCCPCSQGSGAWQLSHHWEICACSEGSSTLGGSPKRAPISQEVSAPWTCNPKNTAYFPAVCTSASPMALCNTGVTPGMCHGGGHASYEGKSQSDTRLGAVMWQRA